MLNKKIFALVIAQSFLVTSLWAAADKACLKTAKEANKTEMATCKDMKGADKKACLKTAKENYKTAKAACSAPAAAAPAAEPAPAPAN